MSDGGLLFVCLTSSLDPAELMATLILHNYQDKFPQSNVMILLDDVFLDDGRTFQVDFRRNFALPTYRVFRSPDSGYRASYSSLDRPDRAFEKLRATIEQRSSELGRDSGQLVLRIQKLQRECFPAGNPANKLDNFVSLMRGLIGELARDRISFIRYSDFLGSEGGQLAACVAICDMALALTPGVEVRLSRGSSLKLQIGDSVFSMNRFCLREEGLVGRGGGGSTYLFDHRAGAVALRNGLLETGLRWLKFEGAAVNFFLERVASLLHVPWYLNVDNVYPRMENQPTFEFISPITNVDPARTSVFMGGGGMRLEPAGYTLLDYDVAEIRNLVEILVGSRIVSIDEIGDWKMLQANMPVTKQKASKSTHQVRHYLNQSMQGDVKNDRLIEPATGDRESVFLYGVGLRKAIQSLNHLRRGMVTRVWPKEVDVTADGKININIEEGLVDIEGILVFVESLIKVSTKWRMSICEDIDGGTALKELSEYSSVHVAKMVGIYGGTVVPFDDVALYQFIAKLEKFLFDEALEYYQLALCVLNTVIKATPLNFYVCGGRQVLEDGVRRLIAERKNRPFSSLRPLPPWKVS